MARRVSGSTPSLILDFMTGVADSRVTFSRSSTATYFNSSGVLSTASSGTPRFDYNPSTLALNGLLIEGQSTNLALHSEDFSTTWTTGASSVTTNTTVAPDGNTTADTITDTSATSVHYVAQSIETASGSTTYTASCFFKAGTKNYAHIQLSNLSNADAHAVFDLSLVEAATGTTGSGFSSPSATITNVGGGWFRCVLTATASNGTSVNMAVGTAGGALASNYNYTGTGSGTVIGWGAQLEKSVAFVSSYIPTTTATVTRAADVATVATSAFPFNPNAGTFVAKALSPQISTVGGLASISDGTASNTIDLIRTAGNAVGALSKTGGSLVLNAGGGTWSAAVVNKIGASYGGGTQAAYGNGSLIQSASGAPPSGVTTVGIGARGGGSNPLNGWLQSAQYWNRVLPNLQSLTS